MFTAQLGKAVIGADEEIVTADMVIVIVWRPMGRDGLGQLTPLQLDCARELLPGSDGSEMNLLLIMLGGCTAKDGTGLALPEALTIAVVEGDVTYRGPAVLNDSGGMESWHFQGVRVAMSLLCKYT